MDESTPPVVEEKAAPQADAVLGRISKAASGITSISALLVCLSSDSRETTWILGIITAVCVACVTVVLVTNHRSEKRAAKNSVLWTVVLSAALLAAAWGFAFRDEIRFSRLLTSYSTAPSVLVADAVSRTLVPATGGGAPQRFVSFVHALVQDAHRTRICDKTRCNKDDVLVSIDGVVSATTFNLDMSAPLPALTAKNSAATAKDLNALLANLDFMENAYDAGTLHTIINGASPYLADLVKTAYFVTAAARATRRHESEVAPLRAFGEQAGALSPDAAHGADWLADAFLFAAKRLVAAGNAKEAIETLHRGQALLNHDPRLKVAEAYLHAVERDFGGAQHLLGTESTSEGWRVQALRGFLAVRQGDFWHAGKYFDASARGADPPTSPSVRFSLRLAAAYLIAQAGAGTRKQGELICEDAEIAREIEPESRLAQLLTGFGWALRENDERANEEFQAARSHSRNDSDALEACEYWNAFALAQRASTASGRAKVELRRRALQMLSALDERTPVTAATLGVMASLAGAALYDEDEVLEAKATVNATRLAARALALDAEESRSNRIMALSKLGEASERSSRRTKEQLDKEALEALKKASESGSLDPDLQTWVSWTYRDLGRSREAEHASRLATQSTCERVEDRLACRIVDIRGLLDQGKTDAAANATNQELQRLSDSISGSERERNEALVELAVAWYVAAQEADSRFVLEQAAGLFRVISKHIRDSDPFRGRDLIAATIDCNLGFIYIDQDRTLDAVRAFRSGLAVREDPDCRAGLAISLEQAQEHSGAVAEFKHTDEAHHNTGILRDIYAWSSKACALAGPLIADASDVEQGRR